MEIGAAAGLTGLIFGSGLSGLTLKIVWDWLKNKNKTKEIPRAGNGFMSLTDLQLHCAKEQANCIRAISATVQGMVDKFDERLKNGDKVFERLEKSLNRHDALFDELRKK